MSFADLRVLASRTVSPADDELVDRFVRLRKEELSLELEAERVAALPRRLKDDLSRFERLRREFKLAQLDRPEFSLRAAIVEDTLVRLEQGDLRIDEAFSRLRQSAKRRSAPVRRGGFGGIESLPDGLPDVFDGDLGDVLGTVAIEVLKHATRGSSVSFPSRDRSFPRSSPPRRSGGGGSGKRGGGFKTGGGF